jgi:hypothetical protein
LLQISAGERSPALRLLYADSAVGWESKALVIQAADGTQRPLAQVVEDGAPGVLAEDGRTIVYPASWSLAGWRRGGSGPGGG